MCESDGGGGGGGAAYGPGGAGRGRAGAGAVEWDNCLAHFSHRLTVHEYKKSTLHLFFLYRRYFFLYSYFSKDIRSPGTFSSMCSLSVRLSVRGFQVLFYFFSFLGMWEA